MINRKDPYNTKNHNHDIKMKYNPERNRWDWQLKADNLQITTGTETIYMAIINKLLTGNNELPNNPTYHQYGNPAYNLLKKNKGKLTQLQIEEYTRQQLKDMHRIKKINHIKVYNHPTDPYTYMVDYSVETITDETVHGELIL